MKVEFHLNKQKKPTVDNGMKVIYGNAKRGGYKLRWYVILAIVISPILFMLYYLFQQYVLTIAPGIITSDPVTLTAPQDGVVASIKVADGDNLVKGQYLIKMTDTVLDQDIHFLRAELRKIHETLDHSEKVNLASYFAAITSAQTNLEQITNIKRNYEKYRKQGQVSQVDYAAILGMYSDAKNAVTDAKIKLENIKIEDQQRRVAGNMAQLARSLAQQLVTKLSMLDNLVIRSPYDGYVVEMIALVGQRVEKGDKLAVVSTNRQPFVITYLAPKYIEKATKNSAVTIIFPNGKRMDGTVSLAIETASKLPSQLVKPFESAKAYLKVKVSFSEPLDNHVWVEGMPVEVQF